MNASETLSRTRAGWVESWRGLHGRTDDPGHHFIDSAESWILSRLEAPIGSGRWLLDAGCGRGDRADAFRRLGLSSIGMDVDSSAFGNRQGRGDDVPLIAGDLHHLPFADRSFDVVLSASVLQYTDWRQVVREYSRVLRPGGEALFIENLRGNPLARTYRLAHRILGWKYPSKQVPVVHLDWTDRHELGRHFSYAEFGAFHLLAPLQLGLAVIRQKVLRGGWRVGPSRAHEVMHRLDSRILRTLPSLRRYCWWLVAYARR